MMSEQEDDFDIDTDLSIDITKLTESRKMWMISEEKHELLNLLTHYYRADRHRMYLETRIREHKANVPYWNNPDYQGLDGLYDALNEVELNKAFLSVKIGDLSQEGKEDGSETD